MLQEEKRDQNCGINHLPNSAGNMTPDYLEVLGCFQTGETSSLYLRFQPQWELTALQRRSKAFSHPSSPKCCGWLCNLLLHFVHFSSLQDVGKFSQGTLRRWAFILFAEIRAVDLPAWLGDRKVFVTADRDEPRVPPGLVGLSASSVWTGPGPKMVNIWSNRVQLKDVCW